MGWVARAGGAVTARSAAFSVDSDEASSQDRSPGLELFDPGQELTSDESGMLGDFHKKRDRERVCTTEK